jgi:hypothetical protein
LATVESFVNVFGKFQNLAGSPKGPKPWGRGPPLLQPLTTAGSGWQHTGAAGSFVNRELKV